VLALEALDVVELDHRVRVRLRLLADVDHDDGDDELGQRDLRRQAPARDEVARGVHVGARVLAERPFLRIEAVGRVVGDRLTRRRGVGEDREAFGERVREVAEAVLAAAASVRERGRRKARCERGSRRPGGADKGGAPVDLRRPVRLDSLPDDLGSARKTHGGSSPRG
jgi:hypothetical protein